MKIRKWISVILTSALLIILPLCGILQSETISGEAQDENDYEIVMEMVVNNANADLEKVEEKVNEITTKEIGCRVCFEEVLIKDHESRMNQLCKGADRIDIISCGLTTTPSKLMVNHLLYGIGDMLDSDAPELKEKCGELLEACYLGDDYYFIPGDLYPAEQLTLFYNKDIVDEYHIQIPYVLESDYASIEALCENVLQSSYDGYCMSNGDGFNMSLIVSQMESFGDYHDCSYGVLLNMDQDRNIVDVYETEEFYEYCKKMEQWNEKGYLVPDSLTTGTTAAASILNQQTVFFLTDMGYSNDNTMLRGLTRKNIGSMYLSNSAVIESGLAISTTTENPDKCLEFLNLLYTDAELANLINYGIEGEHYEKVSEHIIRRLYNDNGELDYGNQILTYGDTAQLYQIYPTEESFYDELQYYDAEHATISNALGYTFYTEPVKQQVAAVESVIDRYRPGLICGIVDVDSILPEFISELKVAGIDEIIAENQRQFDEWSAAQGISE